MTVFDFVTLCAIKRIQHVELLDSFTSSHEQVESIVAHLRKLEMSVSCYSVLNDFAVPIHMLDSRIDLMKHAIDTAERMGSGLIRVFGGYQKVGLSLEDSRAGIVHGLRVSAMYAEQHNVTLVLGNHGFLTGKSAHLREIIESVSHPNLMADIDVGKSLLAGELPTTVLRSLGPLIGYVHLTDQIQTKLDVGREALDGSRFVGTVIGEGALGVREIVATLKELAYDGFLSLVFEGETNSVEGTRESIDSVRSILH